MRLHKISLLNLNSLYGEQSLDLERDLQGASLFLIHGRTGSGKSTVMDAVSLALFGKTPRLDSQRNALGADPCSIMSRGTGECRAEVEFSRLFADRSRVRYRAIWSVRRAHKRADGSLQPVERSLEQLDPSGQWKVLASGKKLVQFNEALSEVLEDFTVDDFHRSMLLAQGRFDELLSAKPEHRAAILERLTNTVEYATIGSNAAEMARAHKKNIEFLNRQLSDATPVSEEEVCKVSEAATDAHKQAEQCTFALNACKSNLLWWTDRKRLRGELSKLDSEHLALEQLAAQLAPALADITGHMRCIAGFAAMDRLENLDHKIATSDAELCRNGALLIDASQLRERMILQRCSDERAAELSASLLQCLQVPCATHVTAQQAAVEAKKSLDGLRATLANSQGEFTKKMHILARSAEALEQANQDATRAKETLAACQKTSVLREQWKAQWQEFCIRLENQAEKLAHDRRDLTARAHQLLDAINKAQARQEAHAQYRATLLAEPKFTADQRQTRLAALAGAEEPKVRIRALRLAVERQRREVAATECAQRELLVEEALQSDLTRANAQRLEAEQAAALATAEAARAREAANHAAARKTDAEKQLHRLELVVEVSKRREALSQGEHCPLCGSVAHPYLDDPPSCPDETTVLLALTDTRSERELLEKAAIGAEQLARESEKAADKCKHERDTKGEAYSNVAAKILSHTETAMNARMAAQLPKHCLSDECTRRLEEQRLQLEAMQTNLNVLEEASEAADEAQQQLAKLQLALAEEEESLKSNSLVLEEQRKALQVQHAKLEETRQAIDGGRYTLRTALQRADANLFLGSETSSVEDAELVVWRRSIEAQIAILDAAERSCEQAASKLRDAQKQQETDSRSLTEAERHLSRAKLQEDEQRTLQQKLCVQAEQLLNEIQGLWVKRQSDDSHEQALPEATDSAEILRRATQLAERLAETARKSRETAEVAIREEQRLQGTLDTLNAAYSELEKDQNEARKVFLSELAKVGVESAEILRTRRMQADELRAAQAKVDDLDRQQQAWKVRQEERLSVFEKHELAIPSGLAVTDEAENEFLVATSRGVDASGELFETLTTERFESILIAAVIEAENQLKAANDDLSACLIRLADTQRRRMEYATAVQALREAQKKAGVWLSLDALIGTRNGDAFRQFAQSLNLHRLIQKANIHLQRLSERYLLTQARNDELPTLDFAIKDLWQGGEPRSTRTLSGGERFLVSLALALGLSDLRTQSLPIETLVLDEGFGTLDPETLEVALAALQRLHAEGRQVGVISHVSGLKEHIEAQVRIVEEGAGRSRIVVGR